MSDMQNAPAPDMLAQVQDGMAIPQPDENARTAFVAKLQVKIDQRVAQKKQVELRFLEDLRQYHGVYEPTKLKNIQEAGGSEEFANITRPKTNTFIARVADMLLPTDDKNWGLEPTPVPKLAEATSNKQPLKDPTTGQPVQTEQGNVVTAGDFAQGLLEVAEQRCLAMEREIDDQLEEANYNGVQREIVKDMGIYGTGILKGPMLTNSVKRKWDKVGVDANGVAQYTLTIEEEKKPGCARVSPWNFFPDMSVTVLKQCEDILERHPMTKTDLIDLAKMPGFDQDAIRALIKQGPQKSTLWYLNELRSISNQELGFSTNTLWEVWEYHGSVGYEELQILGLDAPEDDLIQIEVVVWFCDGHVLKASLNTMDSGDRPYSVGYCEKDDSSIFGFGYPYLLRNSQNVVNGSWRMLIDNAGLSVGPQIIVNRRAINPLDGNWKLKPRKIWEVTEGGQKLEDIFKAVPIDSHQAELVNLFKLAMSQADVETNLPLIAQGMETPDQPESATGMNILHNNASVVLRGAVKSYDDDITRTFLPRMYDWNMQFNPKDDIKGDWRVVAKGAGVLLEKERMTQTFVQLLNLKRLDPEARVFVNSEKLWTDGLRAMRFDDAINSPEDQKKMRDQIAQEQQQQQQAKQGQQGQQGQQGADPQLAQQTLQLKTAELEFMKQKHNDDMQFRVHELASTLDMDEKTLMTKLADRRMQLDHRSKVLNVESSLKMARGSGVPV